jgi:uncharacterized membrane protein
MAILRLFSITAAVFFALDFVWLGFVAPPLYRATIGPLLRESPHVPAAVAFYAVYVTGIVAFAVRPFPPGTSWRRVFRRGALFGFVAYGTFDLTSLAVLEGWSVTITIVDMAWGTALTGSVAALSHRLALPRPR